MKCKSVLNRHVSVLVMIAAMLFGFAACNFFSSFDDDAPSAAPKVSITSLTVGKTSLNMKVGSMDYFTVSVKPQSEQRNITLNWSYDKTIIECDTSSAWGVTVKALKEGQTTLRCSYDGYDASCLITVSGYENGYEETTEPYIYSNTTILQTQPGVSEKVFVSLYGGDAKDIDGYTWTIDNSSVASIQPTGQYCVISAKETGYARIKVTHTKASYPYYIGVYAFDDATNVTYITTQNNILTMNKDDPDQTISVALVNGKQSSLDSSFVWEIVNQDSDSCPIGLQYNGTNAVIKPLTSGSCTIRVSHPDAAFPLEILCRVITIVKNVYVEPDQTIVNLTGELEATVTSELKNIDISGYSIDDYTYTLGNYDVAEITSSVGNQCVVKGKANGSTKLLIQHPKALYTREVLLIVTGQLNDAIDASGYITTSQNYIRTKVGADPTTINISLKGGVDGDENAFVWSIKQKPEDGVSDVITMETPHGTTNSSRAVRQTFAYGTAYITPKAEGTAVITLSHPKVFYTTEILVKVLNKDAILEEPLTFSGSGLLKILNGENKEYTVSLSGKNKLTGDDSAIKWSIDDSRLTLTPNNNIVNVKAPEQGVGCTISHLLAKHEKADTDKSVLVMTADDIETLNTMKALYSNKNYYNIEAETEVQVICSHAGFDTEIEKTDSEGNPTKEYVNYDFSQFRWSISDPTVISITRDTNQPTVCNVKALRAGTTKLTGSIVDDGKTYSCDFNFVVYPKGAVQTEAEVYFTTTQNVVTLRGNGSSEDISISAINLPTSEYRNIVWESDKTDVCTVVGNGTTAKLTAIKEGEAVISISHTKSQNTLKIYVKVGSEFVIPEAEPVVYISAPDVITMLRDDSTQKLQAVLVNYNGTDTYGFSFSCDNESVATIINQQNSGIAYIQPMGSGQCEITISHTKTSFTKKVLIVVGNTAEELAGYTYLTTNNNVVAIGEGQTKSVSVSVKNSDTIIVDGYTWTSSNPNVVDVTSSGATAVLKGNSIGTAMITVTNRNCTYSLQIIAQVVDPIAASANPYIQLTSSVMTLTCSSTYNSITAELVGGIDADKSGFVWSSNDSSIASVYGQNEVGKVKALKAGTTYITVSHPKAMYSAQILVVCDEALQSDCYISVPSSIIQMKPTDAGQTITASLINGTSTDKYNFKWSLDVYDVIDFQYSANVCTITPKQTGTTTITISHPKAAYDQQVIVTVQQYSTFAFPRESMTVTQGEVNFITMQVPTTNVTTHIEYSVENEKICSIRGTKTTAQLTPVGSGTTTVKAKLVASSTGIEQASAEMMVYVKEKETNAVYITAVSTITTLNKGKSQSLTATLTGTGVEMSDQYNLKWTTSDSDIVQVTGIGSDGTVTGQSIYITALKPGEAIITCSHPKAASTLQFYVVVPGSAEKVVTLNKTYITLVKGSNGTTLKANIENKESSADYYSLIWSCESSNAENGQEVVRVMGSGQNVTIYPVNTGAATIMAQLPDSSIVAKCSVVVEAGKSFVFETNTKKVQPSHVATVKYTVSPPDAARTWTMSQEDDFFTYHDNGCDSEGNGSVDIIATEKPDKLGNGTLACVTDGGAKGQISVRVAWDYHFSIEGKTDFTITPVETAKVKYNVSPADAVIEVSSTDLDSAFTYERTDNGNGTGEILIKPLKETSKDVKINILAKNQYNGNEEVGRKTISAGFKYTSLSLDVQALYASGCYSYFNEAGNTLILGDGEDVTMKIGWKEQNANAVVQSIIWYRNNAQYDVPVYDKEHQLYKIADPDPEAVKPEGYLLEEVYAPAYKGNLISDWEDDIVWYGKSRGHFSNYYMGSRTYSNLSCQAVFDRSDFNDSNIENYSNWIYFAGAGNEKTSLDIRRHSPYKPLKLFTDDDGLSVNYSKVRDSRYEGRLVSMDWIKSRAWFYCPGTRQDSNYSGSAEIVNYPNNNQGWYGNVGKYGENACLNIAPHFVPGNVKFTKVVYDDFKPTKQSGDFGHIDVMIVHNGIPIKYSFNVFREVRYCPKSLAGN